MSDFSLTPYIHLLQSLWDEALLKHGNLLLAALLIAIVAIAVGGMLARRIQKKSAQRNKGAIYNFLASLIAPIFLVVAMAGVYGYAHATQHDQALYLFALRLAFAWFVVRLILGLSSKQEAGWIISFIVLPFVILSILGILGDIGAILNELGLQIGDQRITALMVVKGLSAIIILLWLTGKLQNLINQRIANITSIHISHRTLISKLVQISLYFVVFIIALQVVGVDLTALSVFGGALGVGIGFGLQKIASNFISGIILLMERSIQVGDLVELDDGTMGFIRKTGARYTLMETHDYREILIPNEEFIIQRTVSWTHSNKLARVEINIGVAYDSDLDLVQKIMLEETSKHPRCMKDPSPFCFLDKFGDSAINFTIYFYVSNVEEGRLEPRSDVMLAIWRRFKQEGVEIPFPQRVIHYANSAEN